MSAIPTASSWSPLDIGQFTGQGGRKYNEDRHLLIDAGRFVLALVADGAGGQGGGDVAAQIVVDCIGQGFRRWLAAGPHETLPASVLTRLLASANEAVREGQERGGIHAKMCSTAILLGIDRELRKAVLGNCGDSRLYLLRNGEAKTLSRDHSLIQKLIDHGMLQPEEALRHPQRNALFAALGSEETVEFHVPSQPFALQEGDWLFLCSDGFWDYLPAETLVDTAAQAHSAQAWVDALARQVEAVAPENHDNYTAIALTLGTPYIPPPVQGEAQASQNLLFEAFGI
ncbi:MAG: PP2C family serine/threonine-protein phosphatase [Lysobacteraceae bacterium]